MTALIKRTCVLTVMIALGASPALAEVGPGVDDIMARTLSAYDKVEDYTCLFDKTELVSGELIEERGILLKFKKPQSVYMFWREGANKGQETLFVRGRNNDEMQAHRGGALSFIDLSLNPTGGTAMKGNRHPITEAGLGFIISLVHSNYIMAKDDPSAEVRLIDKGDPASGRDIIIEAKLPPDKGYYAATVLVRFDPRSFLVSSIRVTDWDGRLLEVYGFRDVKVNVGLSEIDFDPDNPEYGF